MPGTGLILGKSVATKAFSGLETHPGRDTSNESNSEIMPKEEESHEEAEALSLECLYTNQVLVISVVFFD